MIKFFLVTFLLALTSARITIPITKRYISDPGLQQDIAQSFLVAADNKPSSSFNLSMKNSKNLAYFGQIHVGEKATFQVLLDSGSHILWLPTTSCLECPAKTKYTCSSSSTCSITKYPGELKYGKGYVKGNWGYEMVGFTENTKVNASVLWISSGSELEAYQDVDGFIGLGSMESANDLIDLAYKNGFIEEKIFSFYLDHNWDFSSYSSGSYLAIGYIPEDKADKLTWINVTNPQRWSTKVLGYKVGNKVVDISRDQTAKEVLFDSGCSLLLMSNSVIQELKSQLANLEKTDTLGGTRYRCDAEYLSNYPNMTMSVGGMEININVYSYLFFTAPLQKFGKNYCELGVMQSESVGFQIMGDSFLKNNFVTFSKRNQTLGIYQEYRPIVLPPASNNLWVFILLAVFVVIALGVCCWKKQNARKLRAALTAQKSSAATYNYQAPPQHQAYQTQPILDGQL